MTVTDDAAPASEDTPAADEAARRGRLARFARWLTETNQVTVTVLGLLIALVVGGVLITFTTPTTLHAVATFFDHPLSSLGTIFQTIGDTYRALFTGSIIDPPQLWYSITHGTQWAITFTPISETLVTATPLIIAGLGVGIGFQTGIFNIGGAGQLTMGAVFAAYAGTAISLPAPLHVIVCMLAGILGGALAGAIPGVLKAFTGAHEVIVTIMLNYVIGSLLLWDLTTPGLGLQQPGQANDLSKTIRPSAQLPHLFGPNLRVNLGIIFAVAAAMVAWWLLDRSTLGFRFRTVGASPDAARTAGIDVKRITVLVFLVSAGFVGFAGMVQLNGVDLYIGGSTPQGYQAALGFTAITVALLGRNRPLGITLGAILFAALSVGGRNVQAVMGISPDLSTVIQAVIVLCVATPALVAQIFHLKPGSTATFSFGGWGG